MEPVQYKWVILISNGKLEYPQKHIHHLFIYLIKSVPFGTLLEVISTLAVTFNNKGYSNKLFVFVICSKIIQL